MELDKEMLEYIDAEIKLADNEYGYPTSPNSIVIRKRVEQWLEEQRLKLDNPLRVQLVTTDGKPAGFVDLPEGVSAAASHVVSYLSTQPPGTRLCGLGLAWERIDPDLNPSVKYIPKG